MEHREWLTTDYYAELGVARTASFEEITERYRALAWDLHPDRNPESEWAETEFKRLARAYAVLANPERRRAYDAARDAVFDRGFAPTVGTTRPAPARVLSPGFGLSRRVAIVGGIACLVVGLVVAAIIVTVSAREARIRADGVAVTAVVTEVTPQPQLRFTTREGAVETVPAPRVRDRRNRGYRLGEALNVRYLRSNPSEVVIVESTLARDVTMWIIAAKLLVCGAILIGFGLRQSRSDRHRPATRQEPDLTAPPLLEAARS